MDVPPGVAEKALKKQEVKNPFVSLHDLEALCEGDEDLQICLKDVIQYSLRYAETVCAFEQIVLRGQQSNEDESRKQIEVVRSTIHDATIDAVNILARQLKRAGQSNQWIQKLKAGNRAAYGTFAVLIAFEFVLEGNK